MSSSPTQLSGQAAVVTGGSSGIGRAIVVALAEAGADVFVHARKNAAGAEETAAAAQACGAKTKILLGDLADATVRSDLVKKAFAWRPISIWINNAGVDVLTGAAAKWSFQKKLHALWLVDVSATMVLTRAAGQRMQAADGGAIVNIGWDQAELGMAGDSGELFAATKGAVMAFTRSSAASLAPHVRVNCVAPGWIRTAWGAQASDAWQERAEREALLNRWGTPEDIAAAVRFLASPAAGFITGQVWAVNGGWRRA